MTNIHNIPTYKYKLTLGSLFKNEQDNLVEWINHYINNGVEHFYLINDNSSDESLNKINSYVNKGLIDIYTVSEPRYIGRQSKLYNDYFLPLLINEEVEWLIICNIDEYIWSPKSNNIYNVLSIYNNTHNLIKFKSFIFGSNNLIEQPNNIIKGFTMRKYIDIDNDNKYIVHSNKNIKSISIYDIYFNNNGDKEEVYLNSEILCCNLYFCQSLNYWNNIKSIKGDLNGYFNYSKDLFKYYDYNEIHDNRLSNRLYNK